MSLFLLNPYQFGSISQQTFTSVGTTSWSVPIGVTSISAVLVGGGGGGSAGGNQRDQPGSGGGGLRYINYFPVTPGDVLTITVGAGGTGATTSNLGLNGSPSSIRRGNQLIIFAGGGFAPLVYNSNGNIRVNPGLGGTGTVVGTYSTTVPYTENYVIGGGNGGYGGSNAPRGGGGTCGGGGGAGGYTGIGGTGGDAIITSPTAIAGNTGTGGSGGGGGSDSGGGSTSASGGGGVGVSTGLGATGLGGQPNFGGLGGSNGTSGGGNGAGTISGTGGLYGGGAGASQGLNVSIVGGDGGQGVVKIVWQTTRPNAGIARTYPSTNVYNY